MAFPSSVRRAHSKGDASSATPLAHCDCASEYRSLGLAPSTRRPPFSVVIPTLGRDDELRDTLRSTRSHAGASVLEIIVVFDGVSAISDLDSLVAPIPLRTFTMPTRSGPAACRNLGARFAIGDYLVFLDDDVRLTRTWVQSAALAVEVGRVCQTGPILALDRTVLSKAREARYRQRYVGLSCGSSVSFLAGGNMCVSRRVFDETEGFPDRPVGSDSALVVELRSLGIQCVFCPGMAVGHRNDRGWRIAVRSAFLAGSAAAADGLALEQPAIHAPASVGIGAVNLALWFIKAVGWLTTERTAAAPSCYSSREASRQRTTDSTPDSRSVG